MKLNRKWVLVVSLVLSVAMATGGTLAYLQDQDEAVNVMTLGSVYIEQNEHQRVDKTKAGQLTEDDIEPFEQGQQLLPYVDENLDNAMKDDYEEVIDPAGIKYKFFIGDNAIDKMISVTNTGKSDAYVRTIIALERPTDKIDLAFKSTDGYWTMDKTASSYHFTVDGQSYDLFVVNYNKTLKPGETTPYSLLQFLIDGTATNEDLAAYGETYDILALSQAVQTAGFADAQTALDTAFGVVTADKAAEWFGETVSPVVNVASQAEAQAALDNAEEGTTIVLAPGVDYGTLYLRQSDKSTQVDVEPNGTYGYYRDVKLREFKNLTIIGAEGATVDSIEAEAWKYIKQSGLLHSNTEKYPYMQSFINLKNVKIQDVTFTGEKNAVLLNGYVGIDGLEISGCKMEDSTKQNSLLWRTDADVQHSEYPDKNGNVFYSKHTKNITVENCEINGADRVVMVYSVDGMTIRNNTAKNLAQHFVLSQKKKDDVPSTGKFVFANNNVDTLGERFFRAGGMENAKVVFTNNVVANFTHIEDTDIVKMNGTGITVTDEGNTWPAGKETITIVP